MDSACVPAVKRDLLILLGLVALVRLPFLDQAVQGDDVYYLMLAENARVDPWHPMQMGFRLQGKTVWAAGHTRPPGNAYLLAGLLELFGGVDEAGLHGAFAVFSVLSLVGGYFLAVRFTSHPLIATLCLAVTPAFLVNGNKLESDLPMLALLCCGGGSFRASALRAGRRYAVDSRVFRLSSAVLCSQCLLFGSGWRRDAPWPLGRRSP